MWGVAKRYGTMGAGRTAAGRRPGTARVVFAVLVLAVALAPAHEIEAQETSALLFQDAKVFDGERMLDGAHVLVRDGRITDIGPAVDPPAGTRTIDAAGRTLLPGLIDSHTHVFGATADQAAGVLCQTAAFGVTTSLDMFTDHRMAAALRAEQADGGASDRADLYSAGTLVTAPGGHGTQYGGAIPTLDSPAGAQEFVDARIDEGSDWIKIIYDDGTAYGIDLPTLDLRTVRAVIDATHRRDRLAVVHVGTAEAAREVVEAGADGLVHLFTDRAPDPGFGELVAERDVFVVPTLAVLSSVVGMGVGEALADDARLEPYLSASSRANLTQGFPAGSGEREGGYDHAATAVRQLEAAGARILAGTDAPNPGTAHGASMHQELELLVDAGLSPIEALRAATSVPAEAFGLDDRGRIAPGRRADLVLVEGDPTADIRATRAIVGVWKAGGRIDRDGVARAVAAAREEAVRGPEMPGDGVLSDFDDGEPTARFGTSWLESSDAMAGGQSTGAIEVVDGGAAGSAQSLSIAGTISDAVPFAWYGAMWSPGAQAMAPQNLSAAAGVRFRTRGDGGTYRVLVFSQSHGQTPLTATFVARAEWREITLPWTEFGIDGSDVMAVIFVGGPEPGPFEFRIDDVRLQ